MTDSPRLFAIGETVYLKNGSPAAIVTYCRPPSEHEPNGSVGILWCNPDGAAHFLTGLPLAILSYERNPEWPANLHLLHNEKSQPESPASSRRSKTTPTKS